VGHTPPYLGHRISHPLGIQISRMTDAAPPHIPTPAVRCPMVRIHPTVLTEDLLQSRLVIILQLGVGFPLYFDLEAQLGDRYSFDELGSRLLVKFELHFVYLFDVVDRHHRSAWVAIMLLKQGGLFSGRVGENAVKNGGLVLAQFLLHVEESVVIGVFGVAAVLVFGTCVFVDLVVDEVTGDSWLLLAVETASHLRTVH